MRSHFGSEQRGFTLVDMVAVIAVIGILMAMTVPTMLSSLDRLRLGQASREVEREMQTAKSRAVTKGRAMRIRFNCPGTGQYRIVELIGTPTAHAAADSASNRCEPAAYPFPAADADPLTLPNLDGPIRQLPEEVSFDLAQTIEFWPDGTAHYSGGVVGSSWPMIPTVGINVTVKHEDRTSTISVNGLGKINVAQSQ
jgi:prepilin-type N-terminal cleavage/methylation domain-containing protein